ncbi:MAG: sialidase family protein [Gammaproteobacteria bacterium]
MCVSKLSNRQRGLSRLFAIGMGVLAGVSENGFATPSASSLLAPIYPQVGLADVSSLDVYREGELIHLLVAGPRHDQGSPVLLYLRSGDGGRTWSQQAEVATGSTAPTVSKRGSDAQIAAQGNKLVAVWQTTGEFPGMGPMAAASSLDGGKTWEKGSNPADDGSLADHGYLDIAADSRGRFHIVWLDDREEQGSYQGLRYARSDDSGRTWSRNQTLDEAACTCCWTRLEVGADDRLHVLYRDANPQDMALFQSTDGGETWRRAGPVGAFRWMFLGCPHSGGGLCVVDGEGRVTLHSVVWTGKQGSAGLHHLRSKDYGKTWSAPKRLSQAAGARGDVAAHDFQHLAAVWDRSDEKGSAVLFTHSSDGGQTWAGSAPVSAPGTLATHPRIVPSLTGYAVLWTEKHDGGRRLAVAAIKTKKTCRNDDEHGSNE